MEHCCLAACWITFTADGLQHCPVDLSPQLLDSPQHIIVHAAANWWVQNFEILLRLHGNHQHLKVVLSVSQSPSQLQRERIVHYQGHDQCGMRVHDLEKGRCWNLRPQAWKTKATARVRVGRCNPDANVTVCPVCQGHWAFSALVWLQWEPEL